MEIILIAVCFASVPAALCFILRGRRNMVRKPVFTVKRTGGEPVLSMLLWATAIYLLYFWRGPAVQSDFSRKCYFSLIILACALLGSFAMIDAVNWCASVAEQCLFQRTAFGRVNSILWNQVEQVVPPAMDRMPYVFIGSDGTRISVSGGREDMERFFHEVSERLPKDRRMP